MHWRPACSQAYLADAAAMGALSGLLLGGAFKFLEKEAATLKKEKQRYKNASFAALEIAPTVGKFVPLIREIFGIFADKLMVPAASPRVQLTQFVAAAITIPLLKETRLQPSSYLGVSADDARSHLEWMRATLQANGIVV